jgi:uncharacterized lipoprotein YehR (DUF1307 family)
MGGEYLKQTIQRITPFPHLSFKIKSHNQALKMLKPLKEHYKIPGIT